MSLIKYIPLLPILILNIACANGNLPYSNDSFSEDKYKNNNTVLLFQKFPESNEYKGVLKGGSLFSVKYWAGVHYGVHAVMLLGPQMKTIPDELNSQIIQLAKLALYEPELSVLVDSIHKRNIKLSDSPEIIHINSDEYSEFYISSSIVREAILIEIKLYRG
ncbi:hypothetical protein MNBD_GAMMA18-600 [hydrothermal vent metagenome]|uniref:Uncharacterized protein n=1 Tax=hydrothermal vent metagenome TaxID=652676 RepID=A0A3B1A701_9ZZZZ